MGVELARRQRSAERPQHSPEADQRPDAQLGRKHRHPVGTLDAVSTHRRLTFTSTAEMNELCFFLDGVATNTQSYKIQQSTDKGRDTVLSACHMMSQTHSWNQLQYLHPHLWHQVWLQSVLQLGKHVLCSLCSLSRMVVLHWGEAELPHPPISP